MTIEELKVAVERSRDHAKGGGGKGVSWSVTGPVGFSVIDAMVKTLEAQQARIEALEKRFEPVGKIPAANVIA